MVVENRNIKDLTDKVNELLNEGWKLAGGIGIGNYTLGCEDYFQALFRD